MVRVLTNGALVVVAVQISAHCVEISEMEALRLARLRAPGRRGAMPVMQ